MVFDFDGTIADTLPFVFRCINELADQYGYKKFEKIDRNVDFKHVMHKKLGLNILQVPSYVNKIKRLMHERMTTIKIFSGISDVIKTISKKYLVAVLTSNSKQNVRSVLSHERVKVDFLYADSSLLGKHVTLKKMLKEKKLSNEDILYVGDEVRDIQACKKIGIKIAAVTWGFSTEKLIRDEKPDFILQKATDLLRIVK